MSWELFLLLYVLTFSCATILQRVLLRNDESDPIAFAIASQLLTAIFIGIFAVINGFQMPNFLAVIPNFFIMMFSFALFNICMFSSLKRIGASEFTILFLTNGIWSAIFAVLFLRETFTLTYTLGALLIFAGVVVTTMRSRQIQLSSGSFLALAAGFFAAVGFTNNYYMVRDFDVPSFLVFSFMLSSVGICLIYPKSVIQLRRFADKKLFSSLALLSFLYAANALAIFMAYKIGNNAAQISILSQTTTIVIVLLSIIILKESSNILRKLIGAALGFIGTLLMR